MGQCLQSIIEKYAIRLIAEEHTLDTHSMAFIIALHRHIPYLQIDIFEDEQRQIGVLDELRKRPNDLKRQGEGVQLVCHRLSHADGVREDFWLNTIGASIERGRVLIICGYLHVNFLAEKAESHGCRVVEKIFFPKELPDGVEIKVLSLAELDEC